MQNAIIRGFIMIAKSLVMASLMLLPTRGFAVESTSKTMSFEACIATIQRVAGDLGVVPINIVETGILRMVRFPTDDGSVLITCSKPDRKLVITRSP